MFAKRSLLTAVFAFALMVTGPAALSFAKEAGGGHAGSGHSGGSSAHGGGGASGGHHDTHEGGSGEESSHESGDSGEGHSGGKGKGPKYMGGRTNPKDHTDSEHGVEDDVFHGKHGVRWTDDWKGKDEHGSEEVLEEGEDEHAHH